MENYTIDLFMPIPQDGALAPGIEQLVETDAVKHVWLWSAAEVEDSNMPKATILHVEALSSTALFRDMAIRAEADYVLYIGKEEVDVDIYKIQEFCNSIPKEASMAYAHYNKSVGGVDVAAPTIDCQAGSLRNDFDFGPLLLFRTAALKEYLNEQHEEYDYAGLYQLRLSLSRLGSIYHFCNYVCTEHESDNRKSGEKQFDYVNPAQRNVQIEMELACTHHLKQVLAWLPPCKYRKIDLSTGEFPVEASVVIPVLNRESTIADAIKSVLGQQTSFKFNILVVDNHSTDGTGEIIGSFADERVVHIIPESHSLGIGGCWNLAVQSEFCGRFAVQLDSDDIYSSEHTLQRIVDEFYRQQCAMIVGTYRICDFELNTLPPGVIDHREWSEENGRNNALRINGLGAPRAFFTPVIREVGFPNVSYGEDYAVGLQISRNYRIGRIYDVLYLCRRWGGNSDAALSHEKVNANNLYKDTLRTAEYEARRELVRSMSVPSPKELETFFASQLEKWPAAAEKHAALGAIEVRDLENGITLQYNPARMVSTGAKVDNSSIGARKCFLCKCNRPQEQLSLDAMGCFDVLVNPFPILPFHLTLPLKEHVPQLLSGMYADMLNISKEWPQTALFYNGARCGASAPDHAHLQAVRVVDIPVVNGIVNGDDSLELEPVISLDGDCVYSATGYVVPFFVIETATVSASVALFARMQQALGVVAGEEEPRMNVISFYVQERGYITVLFPRREHRPSCYNASGDLQRLVSPGTLDMAGLVITPRDSDFVALTAPEAASILCEVAITPEMARVVVEKLCCGYGKC